MQRPDPRPNVSGVNKWSSWGIGGRGGGGGREDERFMDEQSGGGRCEGQNLRPYFAVCKYMPVSPKYLRTQYGLGRLCVQASQQVLL